MRLPEEIAVQIGDDQTENKTASSNRSKCPEACKPGKIPKFVSVKLGTDLLRLRYFSMSFWHMHGNPEMENGKEHDLAICI